VSIEQDGHMHVNSYAQDRPAGGRAAQVARVSRHGQVRILAQLPEPAGGAACPVLGPVAPHGGLSNPSARAIRGSTVYVLSAAYLTQNDPNILLANLFR
jgi:hypothetical protein